MCIANILLLIKCEHIEEYYYCRKKSYDVSDSMKQKLPDYEQTEPI